MKTEIANDNWLDDNEPKLQFVTKRRYKRLSAVSSDLQAFGLDTIGAAGVLGPDGFYRIAIPAGNRPDKLEKYLDRITQGGLEFVREAVATV